MDDRNLTDSETARLASFITETDYNDFPDDLVTQAKRLILDTVGVTLYGSTRKPGETAAAFAASHHCGREATVIGGSSSSLLGAALVNGTAAHATDFDDSFIGRPVIHPSAPVVAGLLPVAEAEESSGAAVLTAYIIGVETTRRIGEAMNPNHYQHGFHSTGTIGSFGAMAAAGSLLDLGADQLRHGFAIVASSSSTLKADNFGTMTKPYSAGHAASMGVRAALLAAEGFTGDRAVLEGRYGYGNVMTPGYYDSSSVTWKLGEEWPGMQIKRKLYPCGSYYQGMCEAFRRLVDEHSLTPDDVSAIEVTFAIPSSARKRPSQPLTGIEGRFSAQFLLAVILRNGDLGIEDFTDEFVQDPETKRQMAKVSRRQDPSIVDEPIEGGRHPIRSTARVHVLTHSGDDYIETQRYSPDSDKHPIPEERYEQKFRTCAEIALSRERYEPILDLILSLETLGDIREFTEELESVV